MGAQASVAVPEGLFRAFSGGELFTGQVRPPARGLLPSKVPDGGERVRAPSSPRAE